MKVELNWPIIITAIVAIYSAILSTVNMIANLKTQQQRLAVTLENGLITSGPLLSPLEFIVEIANIGSKAVTINSTDIELPTSFSYLF